jgi:hypothetical protein
MKFTFLKKFVVLAALAAVFTQQSCSDDPDPIKPGQAGFFVVNEGGWGNSNTSISFYDRQSGTFTNDVFAIANQRPLGDQSQSMTIIGDKGYIVVQNSKKIEVINTSDYSSVVTITEGITNPRYILQVSTTKAYVSDWGTDGVTGTVKVLDLTTNTVTKTITGVGVGSNRMVKAGTTVYVTNSGGFMLPDNKVTVIDSNTDTITDHLAIADNTNSLQVDKDGNLWIAATGDVTYNDDYSINTTNSTAGSLTKYGNATLQLKASEITDTGLSNLVISNDRTQLYYIYKSAIYSVSTSATALPTTPFKAASSYYGLAVDPYDGSIIACKAPTFSAAGSIEILDSNGNVKSTFTAGIAPNGCAFK